MTRSEERMERGRRRLALLKAEMAVMQDEVRLLAAVRVESGVVAAWERGVLVDITPIPRHRLHLHSTYPHSHPRACAR